MLKVYFTLVCIYSSLFATPSWYLQREYKSKKQCYYGYGKAKTQKDARAFACDEISGQIKSTISSVLELKMVTTNEETLETNTLETKYNSYALLKEMRIKKKFYDERTKIYFVLYEYHYTTPIWFEQRLAQAPLFSKIGYGEGIDTSKAIQNAKKDLVSQGINLKTISVTPIKSEIVGGKTFVAVAYQSIPKLKCIGEYQNSFLANSSLVKEANKLTNCNYNYKLLYMNGYWYLKYISILEKLSKRELDTFFVNIPNKNLSLQATKYTFIEGESFHLKIYTKKKGYLTLINLYEDGKAGVIFKNIKIEADEKLIFPFKGSKEEFIATLIKQNQNTKDLYFLFLSSSKIELSQFEEQRGTLVSDDEYRFDSVIELSDKYEFTTVVLKTKFK